MSIITSGTVSLSMRNRQIIKARSGRKTTRQICLYQAYLLARYTHAQSRKSDELSSMSVMARPSLWEAQLSGALGVCKGSLADASAECRQMGRNQSSGAQPSYVRYGCQPGFVQRTNRLPAPYGQSDVH